MEIKHTPGPWTLENSLIVSKSMPKKIFGDNGEYSRHYLVCQPWMYSDPKGEELDANNHLIAAAPEMLEACINVLKIAFKHDDAYWMDAFGTDAEKLEQIVGIMRDVVAKAVGK